MGRSGKAYKQLVPPLSPAEKLAADKNKALQVCVTGATGYLAGHIVQRLLAAGHTVHGTARNADNAAAVRHLLAMPGADEQLRLFSADLMQPGSFDEAVKGCDVVIHTASPYQLNVPKGEAGRGVGGAAAALLWLAGGGRRLVGGQCTLHHTACARTRPCSPTPSNPQHTRVCWMRTHAPHAPRPQARRRS
jgi:hypothetical protein